MSGKSEKYKLPKRIKGNYSQEAKLLARWYYDDDLTEKEVNKLWDKMDEKLSTKTEEEIKGYISEARSLYYGSLFNSDYFKNWHPGLIWGLPAPEGFKPGDEY